MLCTLSAVVIKHKNVFLPPSLCEPDLRAQLTDQIKILDSQVEVKQQQLSDLSEFLRRRGDIEAEYARALDKLTERFTHKTKKYRHAHTHVAPLCSGLRSTVNVRVSSGRSSGVSLCVRSGPFCWLKLVLRVASTPRWETPAATHSHSVWSTSRRIHTAYTNGWENKTLETHKWFMKQKHRYFQEHL